MSDKSAKALKETQRKNAAVNKKAPKSLIAGQSKVKKTGMKKATPKKNAKVV